jgi:hypothetical protein
MYTIGGLIQQLRAYDEKLALEIVLEKKEVSKCLFLKNEK